MKGQIIFPKKNPGITKVRRTPNVNNGVYNNVLSEYKYGKRIGVLTGNTKNEQVDNTTYLWWEVLAALPSTSKTLKGWVREDAFSFNFNNSEQQLNPKQERLRIAQKQMEVTQTQIQKVAIALNAIEANKSKLTKKQAIEIAKVKQSYVSTLTKLKNTGAIQVKVSGNLSGTGLGIIPIVIVIVLISAAFLAFTIDRVIKWYSEMKQYESEAAQQESAIKAILEIGKTSPQAGREAIKKLENMSSESEQTQKQINDNQASTDIFSNLTSTVKWAAIGVAVFAGYKIVEGLKRT